MHFTRTTDGVTIAYQKLGRGPALIWMPSLSNIAAQWRIPALRTAYEVLSRECTLVLYDGRGTGDSSRDIDLADLGVDSHVRDLTAVLEATGLRRATLLGYYHSVATAISFAALEPRRVSRLILYGGAPRMSDAMQPAQTQALLSLVDKDWSLFADAAATAWLGWDGAESGRWTAEAFRTATTPAIAKAWFEAARHIDVTPSLAQVEAPTLVLHRQGDQQIPVSVSRRMAAGIPGARLVELPGKTPTLFVEDPAADLSLVIGFVTAGRVSRTLPSGALTRREQDVLRRLAAGDTNNEIAANLGIAVHTVERHLANIYRKLGVRGRTAAVAHALRGT
ncbi:alpha/beta fold hydrolase [Paractinoplanes brasiliensis]|uniref:Alpha/beta hydrolase family protein n=1 Tax=Paractinoplanes brasiliensis TaxID=52695 RepID=A0A4R6JA84_9ACTN|nr:alpha/beta fold hydrolase [Actinoplanes brasiliensis]TDO32564.1 alpha/beta hydrolase family protein [Actinoplanes brasiliensis]GID27557.1 LuxR family transcriptional regulator [Actinoplanes brasiliensis]